jgi:L-2-hydroxyglutarate oxidase LhgO
VSSRNSEVIHAGLYYTPGLAEGAPVRARQGAVVCAVRVHGVEHRRCGKLTVANSAAEVAALRGLQDRAAPTAWPWQFLEQREALALEPALRASPRCIRPAPASSTATASCSRCKLTLERAGGMVAVGTQAAGARPVFARGRSATCCTFADGSELSR